MAQTVIIHYGNKRPIKQPQAKPQQCAHAQAPGQAQPVAIQQPQAQRPVAVPAQDQYRTVVRPRFIGDSFVYVPVKVPTVNPDGSPIKSPGQAFLDWWNGKKD